MKLASFEVETPVGTRQRVGVRDEHGALVDVTAAYAADLNSRGEADPLAVAETHAPPEMSTFLQRGERAFNAARDAVAFVRETDASEGPTLSLIHI